MGVIKEICKKFVFYVVNMKLFLVNNVEFC